MYSSMIHQSGHPIILIIIQTISNAPGVFSFAVAAGFGLTLLILKQVRNFQIDHILILLILTYLTDIPRQREEYAPSAISLLFFELELYFAS